MPIITDWSSLGTSWINKFMKLWVQSEIWDYTELLCKCAADVSNNYDREKKCQKTVDSREQGKWPMI